MERPLYKRKNEKVIVLIKDELGGKIITELAKLKLKENSYLTDNSDENKKEKGTKKCTIKQKPKF